MVVTRIRPNHNNCLLPEVEAIVAAGGIVIGKGPNRSNIAIVRRRRYPGEVALPKGKLRFGEQVAEAARREVREETGSEVTIREFAGTTRYFVDGMPKIVFYYVMDEDEGASRGDPTDTKEIESVEWTSPERSLTVLTHREDRDLVAAVFGVKKGARL